MRCAITFKASRKKALLILMASVGFVAIGVLLPSDKPVVGWWAAAFFSLGIPASMLVLMRPHTLYLRLDEAGFEMGSLFGKHRVAWHEVSAFSMGSIRGVKMITIHFSQGYKRQALGRAVAASLTGIEGAIANSYDAPLDKVLLTLNEWKARFGRGADASAKP